MSTTKKKEKDRNTEFDAWLKQYYKLCDLGEKGHYGTKKFLKEERKLRKM